MFMAALQLACTASTPGSSTDDGGAPSGGEQPPAGGAPQGGGVGGGTPDPGGATGGSGPTAGNGGGSLGGEAPPSGGTGGTPPPVPDMGTPPGPPGDRDDDGVGDAEDNCPTLANNNQADGDADGTGNVCDNCPEAANADQADVDADGFGDVCDPNDDDVDGLPAAVDNCPEVFNPQQADADNDGRGDVCDNCVAEPNFSQMDTDGDGRGDACEVAGDDDADGFPDETDNCVNLAQDDQADLDRDGRGDVCDNCPRDANFSQRDTDGDGRGDACDLVEDADMGVEPPMGCPAEGQTRCGADDVQALDTCRAGVWVTTTCEGNDVCEAGRCVALDCESASSLGAEVGCDFTVMDVQSLAWLPPEGNDSVPWGVLITNVSDVPVALTLTDATGAAPALIADVEVQPLQGLFAPELFRVSSAIYDAAGRRVFGPLQRLGVDQAVPPGGWARVILPHSVWRQPFVSAVREEGFRIVSNAPVTVTQLQPLCCAYNYSGDGSLVPPRHAWGRDYRLLGLPGWYFLDQGGSNYPVSVVVPTQTANTRVTFERRPNQLAPSPNAQPERIEVGPARLAATLRPGELLEVQGATPPADGLGADLSGARITANQDVAALFSASCTRVPWGRAACDHLQEFLPPVGTWGTALTLPAAPARAEPRSLEERTYWRLTANGRATVQLSETFDALDVRAERRTHPGATLCADLAVGADAFELADGETCELATQVDFSLQSDTPVLVLGLLSGQEVVDPGGGMRQTGDPSAWYALPEHQWRRRADVVVPEGFGQVQAQVIVEAGATLTLDDALVDLRDAAGVPGTVNVVVSVPLPGPRHTFRSNVPFSAVLFAWDVGASLAYPLASGFREPR